MQCRRHALVLAAAILGIALARSFGHPASIGLAFACYGALHGTAVAVLGLLAAPLLAGSGARTAALLIVSVSAFAGALGYGTLLGWLLRYRLAPRPLLMIALACAFAASAALVLMRYLPAGGSAWLAILWWVAFSAGLCSAAGRRIRTAREPAAIEQRML
jgi:hypothetical protein